MPENRLPDSLSSSLSSSLGGHASASSSPANAKSSNAKFSNAKSSEKNKLFRAEALERSASPEQLDQLVQVVSPKRWLSLLALGTIVIGGAVWSVLGRIPITVPGQGVLVPLPVAQLGPDQWRVDPSQIIRVQVPTSGRLLTLPVRMGDRVQPGDVLATVDQSEIKQQLQLSREKLAQLQRQDEEARTAQLQRDRFEQAAIAQQRQALQQSLRTVQSLTPVIREKGIEAIQQERTALEQRLQALRDQLPTYEQRWQARQTAHEEGALSRDMVLQAEQEYLSARAQLNQAESQLKQLDVKEADAQREYLRSENQSNELQAQIKNLETQAAARREQDLIANTARQKEIQETQRAIAQLELQLQKNSEITSPYDGQVLEVSAKPGERMEAGASILTLSAQGDATPLVGVMFLPVSEGKKIMPGMAVQLTPTTVKREEYGGIQGRVFEVSKFPLTRAGAASLVGNPDILPALMNEQPHLAVFVRLETRESGRQSDDTLQYVWSSSNGPRQAITAGTTATGRITTEARSPISYVLPIFKSLTGMS
ncbi:NHLP bacteriocin system secretion protein [Thermoleptolyngbya oregonensis NK1-22]|uniref:NHLP bacteriocin system secretion protein n=2 Tax=Thermoleptolyngbya TaxID=2303528 RepID=A0AA96YDS3_9CYAN|nr:NHLP bacteriocin system secretion protein [Thermoleptolyngbya oregonensis NK1-22]